MTLKYRKLSRLFFWLSWIVTIAPLIFYTVRAFYIGAPYQKLALGCMLIVAAILTAISALNKVIIRSTKWIIILGVYSALKNILPLLIMIAIGTIIDELALTPLHKKYRNKYIINKTIDERSKNG